MAMQCIFQGIGLAMLGRVSEGIRMIEKEIAQADATGDETRAAMSRIILAEVYIEILSAKEKPGVMVLFRNFWTLTGAGQQDALVHFLKNLAIMGGLLIVATFGAGAYSLDNRAAAKA